MQSSCTWTTTCIHHHIIPITIWALIKALPVETRDICSRQSGLYSYCEDGYYCCDNNTRCCTATLTSWQVMGVVFAVLLGVCLCVLCAVFLTKKHKLRPRQTVHPSSVRNDSYPIATTRHSGDVYQNLSITNMPYQYPPGYHDVQYPGHDARGSGHDASLARYPSHDGRCLGPNRDVPYPDQDTARLYTRLPSRQSTVSPFQNTVTPIFQPPPYSKDDPVSPPPAYKETL